MQWAFAIVFTIVIVSLMIWLPLRHIRKHAETRPNLTAEEFVASFPGSESDARAAYDFVIGYLPKGVSPHPDDQLFNHLKIDEEDIWDWVLMRLGYVEDDKFTNYDVSHLKFPQTVADLVTVIHQEN